MSAPRLKARAPAGLILEIDVGEHVAVCAAGDEHSRYSRTFLKATDVTGSGAQGRAHSHSTEQSV
jgi:hypothetical protein